jgi:hypothetical protein
MDYMLTKFLENSYLNIRPGQVLNVFLQDIHIPVSNETPLPDEIKRMILTARKYNLKFTALSIINSVKLEIPIWKHPAVNVIQYKSANRRDSAKCLRLNHKVRTVHEALIIATRRTTVSRKPHTVNPSGIGRKNCGCPLCQRDRNEFNCEHPGKCIETAKMFIDCLTQKWNPTIDLCEDLALTNAELEANETAIQTDQAMVFNPDFTLAKIETDSASLPLRNHLTRSQPRDVFMEKHRARYTSCTHRFHMPASLSRKSNLVSRE